MKKAKRKKKALLWPLIAGGFFLGGCTISQEQFNRDVDALVEKPASLQRLVNKPDPDGNLVKMYRDLLQDPNVRKAIYDEAVKQGANWSSERMLATDWYNTLLHRGLTRTSLTEKQAIARQFGDTFRNLKDTECDRKIHLDWPTVPVPQRDHLLQLFQPVVKVGATGEANTMAPTKPELAVAMVALAAKAKEKFSDQEIVQILTPVLEPEEAMKGATCQSLDKIITVVLELDPKYQQTLLDSVIK